MQVLGHQQLTVFGDSEVAAELYCDEALDGKEFASYLDRAGTVTALPSGEYAEIFDDEVIDEQYRRFLGFDADEGGV